LSVLHHQRRLNKLSWHWVNICMLRIQKYTSKYPVSLGSLHYVLILCIFISIKAHTVYFDAKWNPPHFSLSVHTIAMQMCIIKHLKSRDTKEKTILINCFWSCVGWTHVLSGAWKTCIRQGNPSPQAAMLRCTIPVLWFKLHKSRKFNCAYIWK
jgi:hypothetical protein